MFSSRLYYIFQAMRPSQWVKNVIIYTAILFNGKLFDAQLFWITSLTFVIFCAISSASYLVNDLIDAPLDRLHPSKRYRPIASGKLTIQDATFVLFILVIVSVVGALLLQIGLGILVLIFFLLHMLYSLFLKKQILFDIFAISLSFMLRVFAGELVTGFHVPIWLWLTTFFFSLFIASVKRHSEFINHGHRTRTVLKNYSEQLLQFLVNTFAVMTIFAYSFYTFLEKLPHQRTLLTELVEPFLYSPENRKWFMLTIPFVVFGITRYAQLLYQRHEGEAPEKIITKDKILIGSVLIWGVILISLIYVL